MCSRPARGRDKAITGCADGFLDRRSSYAGTHRIFTRGADMSLAFHSMSASTSPSEAHLTQHAEDHMPPAHRRVVIVVSAGVLTIPATA